VSAAATVPPVPALPPASLAFNRLCAGLSKASLVLAVIGLIAVILSVQIQVVGRYVFNDRRLGRGAGLAAGPVCHRLGGGRGRSRCGHIGLESMVALLPVAWRLKVEILIHAFVGLFGGLMLWSGWMWTTLKWSDIKPMLGLPVGMDYLALVVAGALIVLFSVEHVIALLRGEEVVPAWN
jgi:TRAP-type C4-dicarboxylate transport system permease small subunit